MQLKPQDLLVSLKLVAYGIRTKQYKEQINRPDMASRVGWEDHPIEQKEFNFTEEEMPESIEIESEDVAFDEDTIDNRLKIENKQTIWTYRGLSSELYISPSEVNKSINRAINANLLRISFMNGKPEAIRGNIEEFAIHGAKYAFPAESGAETRGIPTGHAAPLFREVIIQPDGLPPVWASPYGSIKGKAITPIYKSVPKAAMRDVELYELLSIVDIFRFGRTREIEIAKEILIERLNEL